VFSIQGKGASKLAGNWSKVAGNWSKHAGNWSKIAGNWSILAGNWSKLAANCQFSACSPNTLMHLSHLGTSLKVPSAVGFLYL
jgi:hypothetical protein